MVFGDDSSAHARIPNRVPIPRTHAFDLRYRTYHRIVEALDLRTCAPKCWRLCIPHESLTKKRLVWDLGWNPIWLFPKTRGPILIVPIIRIIVYLDLFSGPPFMETPIWFRKRTLSATRQRGDETKGQLLWGIVLCWGNAPCFGDALEVVYVILMLCLGLLRHNAPTCRSLAQEQHIRQSHADRLSLSHHVLRIHRADRGRDLVSRIND